MCLYFMAVISLIYGKRKMNIFLSLHKSILSKFTSETFHFLGKFADSSLLSIFSVLFGHNFEVWLTLGAKSCIIAIFKKNANLSTRYDFLIFNAFFVIFPGFFCLLRKPKFWVSIFAGIFFLSYSSICVQNHICPNSNFLLNT